MAIRGSEYIPDVMTSSSCFPSSPETALREFILAGRIEAIQLSPYLYIALLSAEYVPLNFQKPHCEIAGTDHPSFSKGAE
jgi:hypothetical protein